MVKQRDGGKRATRPQAMRRVELNELLVSEATVNKLGSRGIVVEEARQLIDNLHKIVLNQGRHRTHREENTRRLLIGRTDGGRVLTLVVEQTIDPTTWLIVTGWSASQSERRMIGS